MGVQFWHFTTSKSLLILGNSWLKSCIHGFNSKSDSHPTGEMARVTARRATWKDWSLRAASLIRVCCYRALCPHPYSALHTRLTVATSVGNAQTCSTQSLISSSSTLPRAIAPTSPRAWARTPAVIKAAPLVQSCGLMIYGNIHWDFRVCRGITK